MKTRKILLKSFVVIAGLVIITGCSHRNPQPISGTKHSTKRWVAKTAKVSRSSSRRVAKASSSRSSRAVSRSRSSSRRRSSGGSYNPSKPEPYSIESGQSDPEVLGPQTSLQKDIAPVASSNKALLLKKVS